MATNRVSYNFIKYLRLFAAILVVNMHLIGITFLVFPYYNFQFEKCFKFLFDLSLVAVPIFFMITGFIYLDKNKECTYKSILHNFVKYFIYLLIVGSFYSFLVQIFPDKNINLDVVKLKLAALNINDYFFYMKKSLIYVIENKNQTHHMWFMYSLLKIYLFLPILKSIVEKNDKNIYIILFLMLISRYLRPFINKMLGINIINLFSIDYEFIYIMIGGIIACTLNKLKKYKVNYLALIIYVIINICYILKSSSYNSGYDNIVIMLLSVLMFLSFVGIEKSNKIIDALQSNTFEIYLFHPLFIQAIVRTFKVNTLNVAYVFHLIIIYLFMFFVCYMIKKAIIVLFVRKNVK